MTSLPKYSCILLLVVLLLSSACTRHYDARLEALNSAADTAPDSALAALLRIDTLSLSERDANYHRFLGIKLRDKAYISHSSDTTILRVLDYSYSHDKDLYPEALYYGGRVYSDLGDYPTALRYFQDALDLLPEETANLKLRGNVLSQTAQLLNNLHMYQQATTYLQDAIKVDSILNDSINLVYDIRWLAILHHHCKEYDNAQRSFQRSRELSLKIAPQDAVISDIYCADILFSKADTSACVYLLNSIGHIDDTTNRLQFETYAAELYMRAGILDSAYQISKRLQLNKNPKVRKAAYDVLLDPIMYKYLDPDKLYLYINDYHQILEKHLKQSVNLETVHRQSFYNYSFHQQAREKTEKQKDLLMVSVYIFIILLLISLVFTFALKNKYTKDILKLREALDNVKALKMSINSSDMSYDNTNSGQNSSGPDLNNTSRYSRKLDKQSLIQLLKAEIDSLNGEKITTSFLPAEIISSETYLKIKQYINVNKNISDSNPLWQELENLILSIYPNFRNRLDLLSSGNLKDHELRICLLIKIEISPTNMCILLGRTKGTISYRRIALSKKFFGEQLETTTVDKLIRLL